MIALFGAPGAGKTLQGQLLARKYSWKWISYRDLLLRLNDKDIVYALEHGLFIDDAKATQAVGAMLTKIKHDNEMRSVFKKKNSRPREIILDGFPADYRQLKWMIENKMIKDLSGAIVLRVPRGELWRRLVARKRVDDTRAAIERRQDAYERNITGMIRALNMNGIRVREVDGENEPEDVLERVEGVLGDWDLIPEKQYEKIQV
ncbi:nucleoside monophosphate kinase [Candidatus Saccharibacteria bacterium]|nr:nucleoside monophosphate kinase [Candidatus Saccharibacteria bacterium]